MKPPSRPENEQVPEVPPGRRDLPHIKAPPLPEHETVSEVPPGRRDLPAVKDESTTGLPVLGTWPAVYLCVLVVFVLWVVLLATFTRIFA
jgi:hypothetical protein